MIAFECKTYMLKTMCLSTSEYQRSNREKENKKFGRRKREKQWISGCFR